MFQCTFKFRFEGRPMSKQYFEICIDFHAPIHQKDDFSTCFFFIPFSQRIVNFTFVFYTINWTPLLMRELRFSEQCAHIPIFHSRGLYHKFSFFFAQTWPLKKKIETRPYAFWHFWYKSHLKPWSRLPWTMLLNWNGNIS